MTGARRASISAIARRAARRARRRAPTSPTGRMRSAPGSNCARAAGCARSPPTNTAWPRARSTTTPNGVERFQPAEVVILACNGIGTPRLLLNSASARFPDGLANSSGLVGKNLMLHPWPQVVGYVEDELDGDRAPMTVPVEQGVLRDRPVARLRPRLHAAVRPRHRRRSTRPSPAWPPAVCPGARTITASIASCSTTACRSASPARTCRRSTTG